MINFETSNFSSLKKFLLCQNPEPKGEVQRGSRKGVLRRGMENFCEDELNQKYNSYFPTKVRTVDDLLKLARINKSELRKQDFLDEKKLRAPNLNTKIRQKFPTIKKNKNALRILLMNLSGYFSINFFFKFSV